ncbi:hypothetical protein JXD38_07345 [candidate division WOR-3 bacterium]|nr:hypothetical protein [candidate division WOR-3 bacterium]
MATLADLEQAIDTLMGHALGYQYYQLNRRVEEKAYEAYVFGLCLRAADELGATPVLLGRTSQPVPFIFRGGPGQIYSASKNYGFAGFSLRGELFEIHAGVEFKGTSGMTHELDVCIMRHEEARKCRMQPDDPEPASLVAAWECKFYSGNLDKVLGRAFVGLLDDMGYAVRETGMCSNSGHPGLRKYFRPQRRPYPYFELSPLQPSNEGIFVNRLKSELKKLTCD